METAVVLRELVPELALDFDGADFTFLTTEGFPTDFDATAFFTRGFVGRGLDFFLLAAVAGFAVFLVGRFFALKACCPVT